MTIEVIAFILGAIFLVTGIFGGGIEIRELKIRSVSGLVRFIAIICGISFIGLGLWLYLAPRNTEELAQHKVEDITIPADKIVPVKSDPIETIKAELISAIRFADNAESDAQYSLQTDPLYKAYIGEALKTEIANIEYLKTQGVYSLSTLEQQEFQTFNISEDKKEAEVRVIETWSAIYYIAATNTCAGKISSHKLPQTIYLKKSVSGWLVTSIVQDKLEAPPVRPC